MSYYMSEKEMETLVKLLSDAHDFVKGGPVPRLTERLAIATNSLHDKLERNSHNSIACPTCDNDNSHIVATLVVKDNDHYEAIEITVNGKYSIKVSADYPFRSQGNLHILFACEEGHFFIQSYDGHKGIIFVNENHLMDDLELYLNIQYKDRNDLQMAFNYELLGYIERYFKTEHKATE